MVNRLGRGARLLLGFLALCLTIPSQTYAQEDDLVVLEYQEIPDVSVDDLFTDTEDLKVEDNNTNFLESFISDSAIKVFASFTLQGGLGVGWADWIDFTDIAKGFDPNAGVTLNSSFGVSIRPTSDLYGLVSISASYPGYTIALGNLILDYTIADAIFLRFGNALPTWGNARIYNAVDLLSRGPGGSNPFIIKADIPLGLHYLSAIVISKDWYHGSAAAFSPYNLGYGLRGTLSLGPIEWGLGVLYQESLGLQAFTSIKTAFLGIDYFAEAKVVSTNWSQWFFSVVTGFYYEWKTPNIQLGGEYFFNGERDQGVALVSDALALSGHNCTIKLLWKNLDNSGIDWAIEWRHNFTDNTGSVQTGIILTPFTYLNIAIGIPLYYGRLNGEISNFQRIGIAIAAQINASM